MFGPISWRFEKAKRTGARYHAFNGSYLHVAGTFVIENMSAFDNGISNLYREIFMLKSFLPLSLAIFNRQLAITANFVFINHETFQANWSSCMDLVC